MVQAKEISFLVPWGHVAAKAWGCPTNPPVLCLHGIMDNAGSFDRLIALLPKTYYYVCIDLPGHGLSSHFPPGVALSFFNYVLTLKYITEALNWKSFDCIGHSLGGQLSIFYSVIYPNQIKKLISIEGIATATNPKNLLDVIKKLHDSTLLNEKDCWYTYDEVMYALRYKRNVSLNTSAAEMLFKRAVTESNGKFKYNRDFRLKAGLLPLLNIEQITSIYGKLNVKLLFIFSKGSLNSHPDLLQFSNNLIKTIKNSELLYTDGNHDVHNNHPENISSSVTKFLNMDCTWSKL